MNIRKKFTISISKLFVMLLMLSTATFAYSQQDTIVAYVNEAIITSFELKNRITLLEFLNNTKIDDSQKADMIQSMIDEKLLSQIAKNNNIIINFYIELVLLNYLGMVTQLKSSQ